jgi:hypothetical protein
MQEKTFAIRVKTRLLEDGKTITSLAKKLRKSRHAVSQAINHPIFPNVRKLVEKELSIK